MKKTFKIFSFGCKINQFESDYMIQELLKQGFELKDKKTNTDYTIINSCSVTSVADEEILYLIRKQKKFEPNTKIILTGCFAQANADAQSKNPDIYMLLGNSEKLKIVEYLTASDKKIEAASLMNKNNFDEISLNYSSRTRATLKIQDGCNNFCSYCIVPFTRGKNRSSSIDNIVSNIKKYINNGYKEIVLSGIHIGLWGEDFNPSKNLLNLLEEIEQIEGLPRYRLGSIDPAELTDELIEFLINSKKWCSHLHVSLQSLNDKILKCMNRHYCVQEAIEKIDILKNNVSNINIGADIIAGFPGETNADFEITRQNIEKTALSYGHVFPYSPRQYTKAATMPNQIPPEIKKERAAILRKLIEEKQDQFLNSLISSKQNILIEKTPPNGNIYSGIADNYVKFLVESDNDIRNNIIVATAINKIGKKMFAKINN